MAEGGIDCGQLHVSLPCLVSSRGWWLILSIDLTACLARTAREKAFFLQEPISNMSETVLCNGAKRVAVGTSSVDGSWVRTEVEVQAKKHVGGEGSPSHSTASLSDSY